MTEKDAKEATRRPYASPRLVEHGTIEALTATFTVGPKVEKHPLIGKKGSKIRPKPH